MSTPKNCKLCPLGCGSAVAGHGPKKAKLIVVSDYPGKIEAEQGLNMVSKSGQLMRRALQHVVGIDPESEVFFMSIIRCMKPEKDKITDAMITACRRWTTEDFKEVDCNLVLIAGALAFETLLPDVYAQEKAKDKKFSVSHAHGSVYQHLGRTYLITWNPTHIEANTFKAPEGNLLSIIEGLDRRPNLQNCFTTGSMPALFVKDLQRLQAIVEARYGIPTT